MHSNIIAISAGIAVAVTYALYASGESQTAVQEVLSQRKSVQEVLEAGFASPPPGLRLILPETPSKELAFPGEEHIRRTPRWWGTTSCQLVLEPTEIAAEQVDPATVLTHYCGQLEDQGFRNKGSNGSIQTGSLQTAGNTWWVESAPQVIVTGKVVVDRNSGETVVFIDIQESVAKLPQ